MKSMVMALIAAATLVVGVNQSSAAPRHHHHHHYHRIVHRFHYDSVPTRVRYASGKHRSWGHLVCGVTQMAYYGIRNAKYALAKAWLDFKRTFAKPGAVVVQSRPGHDSAGHPGGHVSRIVQVTGQCTAVVADDKGEYQRNICKRLLGIVDPAAGHV